MDIDKIFSNECIIARLAPDSDGYMRFNYKKIKDMKAHRVSYLLFIGKIPKNKVIDHTCRNRSCINPRHLRLLSSVENVMCGNSYFAKNARKTHCPKGHEYNDKNTSILKNKLGKIYRRCKECRKKTS